MLGNEPMLATSLGALADDAIRHGRLQDGIPMLKESTRIYRELGDLSETAINLCRFARASPSRRGRGQPSGSSPARRCRSGKRQQE